MSEFQIFLHQNINPAMLVVFFAGVICNLIYAYRVYFRGGE